MRRNKQNHQKGFTIIELLIATAVFSVVLVVFLSAFLKVSEMFYKGVNLTNTQQAAREIIQNISNDVTNYQSGPNLYLPRYFCVGAHRYSYQLGVQYQPGNGNYGILEETRPCTDPSIAGQNPNTATGKELLEPGMQINDLAVQCSSGLCNIKVKVVYYSTDPSVLYSPSNNPLGYKAPDAQCTGPAQSSQFCATADFSSTVLQIF